MTAGDFAKAGLSEARYRRLRAAARGFVERGEVPGIVTAVKRRGETFIDAQGTLAAGGEARMQRHTIFRVASLTKPIVAAGAMILVEECRLRLDDPIDSFVPELAERRVLARPDAPLDETLPAERPLTLRDLLTMRMGFGLVFSERGDWPIERAMRERELAVGPTPVSVSPETWLERLGSMPLIYQPGTAWMYDTSSDVLGVLIARVTGQTLGTFLRDRLFEPLGMKDTGFSVPPDQVDRLATAYASDRTSGGLAVWDDARSGRWSRPPIFESARGGLVSTADDLLAFAEMMLNHGQYGGRRILARPTVEAMTTNQVQPEQAVASRFILEEYLSWGFGMAVVLERHGPSTVPGQFGWTGGYGTAWTSDPAEQMTTIMLTQRLWDSAGGPAVYHDVLTLAYQAIDD